MRFSKSFSVFSTWLYSSERKPGNVRFFFVDCLKTVPTYARKMILRVWILIKPKKINFYKLLLHVTSLSWLYSWGRKPGNARKFWKLWILFEFSFDIWMILRVWIPTIPKLTNFHHMLCRLIFFVSEKISVQMKFFGKFSSERWV